MRHGLVAGADDGGRQRGALADELEDPADLRLGPILVRDADDHALVLLGEQGAERVDRRLERLFLHPFAGGLEAVADVVEDLDRLGDQLGVGALLEEVLEPAVHASADERAVCVGVLGRVDEDLLAGVVEDGSSAVDELARRRLERAGGGVEDHVAQALGPVVGERRSRMREITRRRYSTTFISRRNVRQLGRGHPVEDLLHLFGNARDLGLGAERLARLGVDRLADAGRGLGRLDAQLGGGVGHEAGRLELEERELELHGAQDGRPVGRRATARRRVDVLLHRREARLSQPGI